MATGEQGPLDSLYTNKVLVIIISLCCSWVGLILNLIAFFTAKNPEAKGNAKLGLIINAVAIVVGMVLWFVALGGMIMGAK